MTTDNLPSGRKKRYPHHGDYPAAMRAKVKRLQGRITYLEQLGIIEIEANREIQELQIKVKRLRARERLLVEHFRNVDVSEGKRGDLDNASPAESAIRVMSERKTKVKQMKKELRIAWAEVQRLQQRCLEWEGEVRAKGDECKRLRKDQQWMHSLIGQLHCLFPNTSSLALLGNVKRLRAKVKRLEPEGLAQSREIKKD